MEIFIELLILLVATRACGEAAIRVGQPAAVGELIAGVVLAMIIAKFGLYAPFLENLLKSPVLDFVADFGIFFLVLLAGIEMRPSEMSAASKASLLVAVGGVVVPLIAGFGLAWIFLPETEMKLALALLVGVASSISAIPATVKVLMDFDALHQQFGQIIISAAVFDDVIGLFLLAVLTGVIQTGAVPDLAALGLLVVKVGVFFAITIVLGVHVYPRVSRRMREMRMAALEFSALIGVGMAYGLLAEALGMHWVMGAFMAGLYFESDRVGERAYCDLKLAVGAITYGLFGPLFFATIGLRVDLGAVTAVPLFLALLLLVAFAGKFVGCGGPALLVGLRPREAAAVGVGMSARGAVELVVLNIAYGAGLFTLAGNGHPVVDNLYSALVLMAVITTLVAPIMLRGIVVRTDGPLGDDARGD